MVSEEEYTHELIERVRQRPVIYEVDLTDYKNKNKKGEAFKELQDELRGIGCSEAQVQATYKKWISIKRKFRVEYFRAKARSTNEIELDELAGSRYSYYSKLKFLIPYCEHFKSISGSKRKHSSDENDDYNDEENCSGDADIFSLRNNSFVIPEHRYLKSEFIETNYLRDQFCGPANHSAQQISATISGLSTLLGQTSELPAVEIRQNSPITSITDLSKPTDNVAIMAENNLFGQLVANEIDKLPPHTHNFVRAQVLLLLAQASQNNKNVIPASL